MMLFRLLFICFLLFSTQSFATPYLTKEEIPNIVSFLPPPPSPNTQEFINDKLQYELGKSIRNTPRGQQAIEDASHELQYIVDIFTKPHNISLTPQIAPNLFKLLQNISDTTALASNKAKTYHHRQRPFAYFNEATPLPELEKKYFTRNSYPSGHSIIGWTNALIFASLLPQYQTEILKRGYEYGQSRVIVGYHYQTDVDASRLISSALVTKLFQDKEFLQDFNTAKQELTKLSQSHP